MDYAAPRSQKILQATATALEGRNIHTQIVNSKAEAMAAIRALIPEGAEVTTGSSTTLDQIGFVDLLKSGDHPWKNLKEAIVNEQDATKQAELRRQSSLAEYFLGSVHAITEDGVVVTASASGSQLAPYAFTSQNVIWVVGAQKIVPNLDEAMKRVREYVFPLEDARMKSTGAPGSVFGKWLIFEREVMPRKIHLILVNEVLGF